MISKRNWSVISYTDCDNISYSMSALSSMLALLPFLWLAVCGVMHLQTVSYRNYYYKNDNFLRGSSETATRRRNWHVFCLKYQAQTKSMRAELIISPFMISLDRAHGALQFASNSSLENRSTILQIRVSSLAGLHSWRSSRGTLEYPFRSLPEHKTI